VVAAILHNLLSNALKYTPPGKRIWVRVHGQRDGAVCSVQDEGPGLSAEEQAHLFKPGVRVGPMPSAGESSMGYGLALARQFTEMLRGRIWCSSVKGQGATAGASSDMPDTSSSSWPRELLDADALSADSRAHRATRVAPDVIWSTIQRAGAMSSGATRRQCL
jgi:signal transduction histidine kinase